jgi:hypothetical protein
MKWTNHERLDIYGIHLTGWPEGIPAQNPSTLKLSQNKQLLEGFQSGAIKFERHPANIHALPDSGISSEEQFQVEEDDLSWALDTDATAPGTVGCSVETLERYTSNSEYRALLLFDAHQRAMHPHPDTLLVLWYRRPPCLLQKT